MVAHRSETRRKQTHVRVVAGRVDGALDERHRHDAAVSGERASFAVRLIDWYQAGRAGQPSPCRFTPSCSTYAREAYLVHGRWRGSWLTFRRLLRCRPFGPSGFDPVPPSVSTDQSLRTHR